MTYKGIKFQFYCEGRISSLFLRYEVISACEIPILSMMHPVHTHPIILFYFNVYIIVLCLLQCLMGHYKSCFCLPVAHGCNSTHRQEELKVFRFPKNSA
jgi:hypothetical protein